jgi:hypothetical protein
MRSIRKFSILHDYKVNYVSDCTEIPQRSEKIRVLSTEEERKLMSYLKENFNLTSLGILLSLFIFIHVCKTMQRLPNPNKSALKKTLIEIGVPKSPCSVRTIPLCTPKHENMEKMDGLL